MVLCVCFSPRNQLKNTMVTKEMAYFNIGKWLATGFYETYLSFSGWVIVTRKKPTATECCGYYYVQNKSALL